MFCSNHLDWGTFVFPKDMLSPRGRVVKVHTAVEENNLLALGYTVLFEPPREREPMPDLFVTSFDDDED